MLFRSIFQLPTIIYAAPNNLSCRLITLSVTYLHVDLFFVVVDLVDSCGVFRFSTQVTSREDQVRANQYSLINTITLKRCVAAEMGKWKKVRLELLAKIQRKKIT